MTHEDQDQQRRGGAEKRLPICKHIWTYLNLANGLMPIDQWKFYTVNIYWKKNDNDDLKLLEAAGEAAGLAAKRPVQVNHLRSNYWDFGKCRPYTHCTGGRGRHIIDIYEESGTMNMMIVRWIFVMTTSIPVLSVMFMSKGLAGPQHCEIEINSSKKCDISNIQKQKPPSPTNWVCPHRALPPRHQRVLQRG